MRIPVTGSKVHRVWKCPPSAILPQVISDQSKHEPARGKGKAIHRYLERVRAIGEQALDEMDNTPTRDLCAAIDLDDVPVGLATEVAFAWNWRAMTARPLVDAQGQPIGDRHYELAEPPISPDEISATLDLVGVADRPISGLLGYVGDYKSGHGKYPAPDQFGQLLLGALCVRGVYGCYDVVVELIHIHDDGTNHKARRTVNEWDLDAFAAELKAAMELVEHWEAEYAAGRDVAAHEGPWCQYCDAYKNCPAKVALVRAIPDELLAMGVRPGKPDPEDPNLAYPALVLAPGVLVAAQPQRLADAWMMRERIIEVLNRVGEEICSLAAYEPVPLPDGRVIGFYEGQERKDADGRISHQVLEKRYGRETADGAVSLDVTFAAIHQAVQKHIRPGEKFKTKAKDGVEDAVLAEIDKLGGMTTKIVGAGVRPHVPKKKRLPSG